MRWPGIKSINWIQIIKGISGWQTYLLKQRDLNSTRQCLEGRSSGRTTFKFPSITTVPREWMREVCGPLLQPPRLNQWSRGAPYDQSDLLEPRSPVLQGFVSRTSWHSVLEQLVFASSLGMPTALTWPLLSGRYLMTSFRITRCTITIARFDTIIWAIELGKKVIAVDWGKKGESDSAYWILRELKSDDPCISYLARLLEPVLEYETGTFHFSPAHPEKLATKETSPEDWNKLGYRNPEELARHLLERVCETKLRIGHEPITLIDSTDIKPPHNGDPRERKRKALVVKEILLSQFG